MTAKTNGSGWNPVASLERPTPTSLALNVLAAVGGVAAVNAVAFALGWYADADVVPPLPLAPPGYVVGAVWLCLFSLAATARWRLNAFDDPRAARAKVWILVFLVAAACWPLYVGVVSDALGRPGELVINLLTVGITAVAIARARPVSRLAAALLVLIVLWVSFVTVLGLLYWGWL